MLATAEEILKNNRSYESEKKLIPVNELLKLIPAQL
jgi:hypothetical protein